MNIATPSPMTPDLTALKAKQQATWSSGNYARIGSTLQIVGETLCEAIDLRAGTKVLDVAAGNGNASIAAARRFADVTSTDYVADLLEAGQGRAEAQCFPIRFQVADAEALPFEDESFDVVLSTFGVMFTPDQAKAADEMVRVVSKGGKIGMANWTPSGFIGQVFKRIGKHLRPPAGVRSPALWGDREALGDLFDGKVSKIEVTEKEFVFRYLSPDHFLSVFRGYYGPMLTAFEALGDKAAALDADLRDVIAGLNRDSNGAMIVPGTYAEVVITK